MLSTIDVKNNTFNLDVVEPRFKQKKSEEDYKATHMKIKLDHINVIDKIKLHKQIGEMIFVNLLQTTISNTKLQLNLEKVKHQLNQEKIENRS